MILLKCIIFLLGFLFLCYREGTIVSRVIKNKNRIFNFLFGFLLMLGVNQLVLTPCILLHTTFSLAYYIVISINLILALLSFGIAKSNQYRKIKISKLDILLAIIIIVQIILVSISYKENADDSFYVGLSESSIDSEAIYTEEPSMGYATEDVLMTPTEQIPTFDLQRGIFSKIIGVNSAVMSHFILPIILIILAYLAMYYFAKSFMGDKNAKKFLIVATIILLFSGFSTKFRTGCLYIKIWQGKAAFLMITLNVILASLIRIERKVTKRDIITLLLANLASIALTSVAIFLIPFTYIGFGMLKLIKRKWKDILYLIVSFIPVIVYVIIYLLMNINANGTYTVPTDSINILDVLSYYGSNAYLVYYLIATIIIFLIGKPIAKKYFVYVQIVNLLTIWNPLFSNIIATYFTSSAVFWRVLWLAPIEFAIAYAIVMLVSKIKAKQFKILGIIGAGILIVLPGKFVYQNIELTENLENIPQYVIDTTDYILSQTDEEYVTVLGPQIYSTTMRQLTSKIKLIYSRDLYIYKVEDEEYQTERINLFEIYSHNYIYSIEEFNAVILNQKIDYVIVKSDDSELIEYINQTNLSFDCEISGYNLYKI